MKSNIYIKRDIDIRNGLISLENIDCFWYLCSAKENDGYKVICRDSIREYSSLEELNKDFISLEDFLRNASKLGYQFVRTEAIIDNDGEIDRKYTYLNGYNEYIALLYYEGITLAYQVNPYFDDNNYYDDTSYHQYTIIPKYYTKDGNYSLSGYSTYLNKKSIYDEIVKEEKCKLKRRGLVLKKD